MADQIIITNDNLKDIIFEDVKFDSLKRSTINGDKIEVTHRVTWNGSLAETAMKQASLHQAKNWYNNNRPIFDKEGKIQTLSEFEKRTKLFINLNGNVNEIEAVESAVRVKKQEHSTEEIVKNMLDKSLPDDQKTFWKNLYNVRQAEVDENAKLLAKIK